GATRLAAEHPRQLLHAFLVVVEPADARARVAAGVFLPDDEVRRGEAGDLRQVGDADDLVPRRELLELPPDDLGDAAADAGVDLVEDERGRGAAAGGLEEGRGDGELDARELAARGNALHRLRLLAAVRGDEDLDAVDAVLRIVRLFHRDAHRRAL